MANVTIRAVKTDEPGFLKRQRKFTELTGRQKAGDPTAVDEMVALIAERAETDDGSDPAEAIWELSGDEIDALMERMNGSVNPTK